MAEPIGDHVREREFPDIAQWLDNQKEDDRPADQPSNRVDHAIEAIRGDNAGNAEQRGRAEEVASERPAILPCSDLAPRGKEVLRGTGAPRRPVSNQERQDHKCEEEADRERVVGHREVLSFEVTKAGIKYPVRPQHIDEAEQER